MILKIHALWKAILADERAASLVEYALLIGLLILVAVGALDLIGSNTSDSLCASSDTIFDAGCP